ncbi:MAG: toll/interleukin-1 receptor domain-containing protein [Saprospiraceae bacterium]|nr:toll/interleukin-1 receptor domain-containing protein [Saprospiraceae bacterium]
MKEETLRVFLSYSAQDRSYRDELLLHIRPLVDSGLCKILNTNEKHLAGENWSATLAQQLASAEIVLLLLSADYLNSDYLKKTEMIRAIEENRKGLKFIIPIIVRPADWQGLPIDRYAVLPKDGLPMSFWPDEERQNVWENDVIEPLRRIFRGVDVKKLRKEQEQSMSTSSVNPSEVAAMNQKIKRMISDDNLEAAIVQLLDWVKSQNDLKTAYSLALTYAQYKAIQRQNNQNFISNKEFEQARSRVALGLMTTLEEINQTAVGSH